MIAANLIDQRRCEHEPFPCRPIRDEVQPGLANSTRDKVCVVGDRELGVSVEHALQQRRARPGASDNKEARVA